MGNLPKWKKAEVVYCEACDIATTVTRATRRDDAFLDEPGLYCPKCNARLGDLPAESEVKP